MPDWALGGHLAMSVSVLVSAERERFRLGYLADAAFPHLKHRGLPQLKTGVTAYPSNAIAVYSSSRDGLWR